MGLTKIACVQMDVALSDVEENLNRIQTLAGQAASQGAELVVFPECAITGYCFESKDEAMSFAADVPGKHTDKVHGICRDLNVSIVVGSLERAGDHLYNVALCVGPEGLIGSYRKTHLPALGVDHFTKHGASTNGTSIDGSRKSDSTEAYQIFVVGSVRVGMLICYDASFPEASRILALKGADVIVLPTNWPPGAEPTADYVINARASESKVYYLAASRIGHERGFDFIGKSKICDVHGNTLAFANHREAEILYAEIDPELARDKTIYRAAGHSINRFKDRRPELYGDLTVLKS